MDVESTRLIIEALKEEQIDLYVTLPEEPTVSLTQAIQADPYFTCITVASEDGGVSLCAGAAIGGRRCVFVTGVAGLLKILGAMEHGVRPSTLFADEPIDALQGTPFRVLHAADIGIGIARAIRAAVSGRPGGVERIRRDDRPPDLGQNVLDQLAPLRLDVGRDAADLEAVLHHHRHGMNQGRWHIRTLPGPEQTCHHRQHQHHRHEDRRHLIDQSL